MKIVLAIYLSIHGFAHIVGFLVSWKIMKSDDQPYSTKLLSRKIDVGDMGIRIMGILWLLTALGFFLSAYGVFSLAEWWNMSAWLFAIFSLLICLISLPNTKFGVLANVLLIVFLIINKWYEWI